LEAGEEGRRFFSEDRACREKDAVVGDVTFDQRVARRNYCGIGRPSEGEDELFGNFGDAFGGGSSG
jgi:hypothetical protein